MASSPLGTIIALMLRVLGAVFSAPTWATWQIVLKAAHALPLTDDEEPEQNGNANTAEPELLPRYSLR